MSLLTRACLLAIPLALSACSTFQKPTIEAPQDSIAVMQLEASGEQIFQCSRDMKGWFWRFETPNAYLFDPATNQALAKHGYRFSFTHNDGSTIYTRIIRVGENDGKNIPEALFSVIEHKNNGRLGNVRYVLRTKTSGGMPTRSCTEARKDQWLKVPFEATYTFYR